MSKIWGSLKPEWRHVWHWDWLYWLKHTNSNYSIRRILSRIWGWCDVVALSTNSTWKKLGFQRDRIRTLWILSRARNRLGHRGAAAIFWIIFNNCFAQLEFSKAHFFNWFIPICVGDKGVSDQLVCYLAWLALMYYANFSLACKKCCFLSFLHEQCICPLGYSLTRWALFLVFSKHHDKISGQRALYFFGMTHSILLACNKTNKHNAAGWEMPWIQSQIIYSTRTQLK